MIKRLQTGLSPWAIFIVSLMMGSLLMGCSTRLPGQPHEAHRWRAPAEITDFDQLYAQNCAGCHGAEGRLGAARSLNDPLYLSFVSDEALSLVISTGSTGTSMPAFSQPSGGSLTDQQIALLIAGMRTRWSRPDDFKGVELPRYSVTETPTSSGPSAAAVNGSPVSTTQSGAAPKTHEALPGAAAFQTYCARCHGTDGAGGPAGSIVDPNFLNMVSDQGLRTTVVVGRSDLGKPDWRANLPGQPMSPQEIDDVVAWLLAHRQPTNVAAGEVSQSSRLHPK